MISKSFRLQLIAFILVLGVFSFFTPLTTLAQDSASQDAINDLPKAPKPEKQEKRIGYNPQGSRDPFMSLLEGQDKDVRPPGLGGIQISELTLQGIQIGLGKMAIVKGPDNIAYGMHVGESVFDGKLIEILDNKIVFEKLIYDAFGREKEKQKIEIYLHRK